MEYINCNITLDSVRRKTPYTLILKGEIRSGFSANFELTYTGVEFGGDTAYIPELVREIFKEDLVNLVGHGPFNGDAVKKIKKIKNFTYIRNDIKAERHHNFEQRLRENS